MTFILILDCQHRGFIKILPKLPLLMKTDLQSTITCLFTYLTIDLALCSAFALIENHYFVNEVNAVKI